MKNAVNEVMWGAYFILSYLRYMLLCYIVFCLIDQLNQFSTNCGRHVMSLVFKYVHLMKYLVLLEILPKFVYKGMFCEPIIISCIIGLEQNHMPKPFKNEIEN